MKAVRELLKGVTPPKTEKFPAMFPHHLDNSAIALQGLAVWRMDKETTPDSHGRGELIAAVSLERSGGGGEHEIAVGSFFHLARYAHMPGYKTRV